jgi:hypothetical protein
MGPVRCRADSWSGGACNSGRQSRACDHRYRGQLLDRRWNLDSSGGDAGIRADPSRGGRHSHWFGNSSSNLGSEATAGGRNPCRRRSRVSINLACPAALPESSRLHGKSRCSPEPRANTESCRRGFVATIASHNRLWNFSID